MAISSQRSTETSEANDRVEDTAELGGLSSEAPLTQDVAVPAQLLRATTSGPGTNASSIWSTSDPFSTNHNTSPSEALRTYGHSCSRDTFNAGLNVELSHDGQQPRRGTLQSVFNAVVPDVFHRRLTHASYLRKSSIWQTYEKAKMRSIQIQRSRWVQLTFEYGFYATLILFTYFILVGVPLWKGAVYWLWWVVAHKFVIAGGFSVTVGIAFL
jgi:hypothetical protein